MPEAHGLAELFASLGKESGEASTLNEAPAGHRAVPRGPARPRCWKDVSSGRRIPGRSRAAGAGWCGQRQLTEAYPSRCDSWVSDRGPVRALPRVCG